MLTRRWYPDAGLASSTVSGQTLPVTEPETLPTAVRIAFEAAARMGAEAEILDPEYRHLFEIRAGDRRRTFLGGRSPLNDAIAARLADEGAAVFLTGTDASRAEAAAEALDAGRGRVRGLGLDLTDHGSVKRCVAAASANGGLQILVNNAGVSRDGLLARQSADAWREVMATNLDGLHACCQAAVRPMMRARYGRIVNLSSIVGLRGNPGQTAYAASKAGIVGFTKALAKELARRNITVNAVAPGLVETDMTRELPEAARSQLGSAIAMGRSGSPEEVAAAVAFLASAEASYITGAVLEVTGGLAL